MLVAADCQLSYFILCIVSTWLLPPFISSASGLFHSPPRLYLVCSSLHLVSIWFVPPFTSSVSSLLHLSPRFLVCSTSAFPDLTCRPLGLHLPCRLTHTISNYTLTLRWSDSTFHAGFFLSFAEHFTSFLAVLSAALDPGGLQSRLSACLDLGEPFPSTADLSLMVSS